MDDFLASKNIKYLNPRYIKIKTLPSHLTHAVKANLPDFLKNGDLIKFYKFASIFFCLIYFQNYLEPK